MRIYFTYPINTMSGKREETVFSSYNDNSICVAREYVVPTYTDQNANIGLIATNLGRVYDDFDQGYKADLRTYAIRANNESAFGTYPINHYAFYYKMWWAVNWGDPLIDLKTITFADIGLLTIPITTVKIAIDNGFLPPIANYADLTASYNGDH